MARLEEKYLGHVGTFDYVDTRTFLRSIDNVLPDIKPLFEKYAKISTGGCWRRSPIRSRTGIRRRRRLPASAA